MSDIAQGEAIVGNNELRVSKAYSYIYSITIINNTNDLKVIKQIENIIFPNGANNNNQKNDVLIVFTALADESILITNDGASKSQPGGILGHRNELKNTVNVTIMTDEEAVILVREKIQIRDNSIRKVCQLTGESLPDWIGKD
ncbi:MAG: hypothetical protein JEZ00_17950 [Anaerolineaceae bacterium]|nr:hypothetical protein [Anaerolineaceae bacterium]